MLNDMRAIMKKKKLKGFPISSSLLAWFAEEVASGRRDKHFARQSLLKIANENAEKDILWNEKDEPCGTKTHADFETRQETLDTIEELAKTAFQLWEIKDPETRAKEFRNNFGEYTESY